MAAEKKTISKPEPKRKSAYGTGCLNIKCKLRQKGCAGFEACPGFMKDAPKTKP